jgi:hypothetical protein
MIVPYPIEREHQFAPLHQHLFAFDIGELRCASTTNRKAAASQARGMIDYECHGRKTESTQAQRCCGRWR